MVNYYQEPNHDVREFYNGLGGKYSRAKAEFREEVIEATGISVPSFYLKIRTGKWTKAEAFVLNNIIERRKHAGED